MRVSAIASSPSPHFMPRQNVMGKPMLLRPAGATHPEFPAIGREARTQQLASAHALR